MIAYKSPSSCWIKKAGGAVLVALSLALTAVVATLDWQGLGCQALRHSSLERQRADLEKD
jgi:hypothetical protein